MGNYQSAIEVDALRGFAIADHIAPFVVINDNDSAPLVLHAPAQGGRQPSSNGASVSSPNERDHQRAHAQETDGGPSPYVVRRHRVGPALLDLTNRMLGSDALYLDGSVSVYEETADAVESDSGNRALPVGR